jgi:hypothetical protein
MDINIKSLDVPRIRKDGRAIEFVLVDDNDEEIRLTVPASECDKMVPHIAQLMQALTTAKVTRTLHPEEDEEFKSTPVLYHAAGIGFVSQPNHDIAYVIVPTVQGSEVQICFQWRQIRKLISLA